MIPPIAHHPCKNQQTTAQQQQTSRLWGACRRFGGWNEERARELLVIYSAGLANRSGDHGAAHRIAIDRAVLRQALPHGNSAQNAGTRTHRAKWSRRSVPQSATRSEERRVGK